MEGGVRETPEEAGQAPEAPAEGACGLTPQSYEEPPAVSGVFYTHWVVSLSPEERRAILNGMYAMEEDAAITRPFNTGVAEAASAHAAILRALLERLK